MPVPVPVSGTAAAPKNIWVAAGEGDLDRVRHLVDVEGLSPTVADQWTYTPIHAAASYGQLAILRFLLNHASAPENAVETTDGDGDTALFVVEDVNTARCLIEEFNANAKHENKEGNTPAANAEENENEELAAYLRSVTGEEPMYQRDVDPEEDGEEGQPSSAMDEAIDRRTDAMMERVQEILRRAEARGVDSGQDLSEEEEAELRRVVGESVLTQIREGWGQASATETDAPTAPAEGQEEDVVDDEDDRIVTGPSEHPEEESQPRR